MFLFPLQNRGKQLHNSWKLPPRSVGWVWELTNLENVLIIYLIRLQVPLTVWHSTDSVFYRSRLVSVSIQLYSFTVDVMTWYQIRQSCPDRLFRVPNCTERTFSSPQEPVKAHCIIYTRLIIILWDVLFSSTLWLAIFSHFQSFR